MRKKKLSGQEQLAVLIRLGYTYSIYSDRFKSTLRLIIFVLHKIGVIDLKSNSSDNIRFVSDLLKRIDERIQYKIKRNELLEILGLSKNTFVKQFKEYLNANELVGRRTYTLNETYKLLLHWKGDAMWYRLEAFSKQELANYISNGDYKKLSGEFDSFMLLSSSYKENDKLSPKLVNSFLKDLNFSDEKIEEIFLANQEV